MDGLATKEQLAEYLNIKPGTLDAWAKQKRGPVYIKIEGQRRYRWSDVEAYLEERTVRHG
jgi:predicted site-specific integrase-resolvase